MYKKSLFKTRNQEKRRITTFALILLLTFSAITLTLPAANAHTPAWNVPTYAYLTASPSNVGVGQYTVFVMWLDKFPPTAGGLGGDRWKGFQLDITKPDGSKQTLSGNQIMPTSAVGSTWTQYMPDQVGTYTAVFSWPGQILSNGTYPPLLIGVPWVGDNFLPATSAPIKLTVTQEKVQGWQEPAVPTGYWNRPINSANREWSRLASNWLKGSWLVDNFQSAGQAPNSPHIVWAKPIMMGGIPDAQWPGNSYDTDDYESPWTSPIIMNGVIFYNTGIYPKYGYYALDLRTGEQLWYKNGTDNGLKNTVVMTNSYSKGGDSQTFPLLGFGQLYHYYSVNGQGVLPYLWITQGSNWYMLDADTGNWILTLKNVPGGTAIVDQDGSLLRYSYNAATGQLLCWNSSQSIPPLSPTGTGQQQWKPRVGATIDAVNDTSWTQGGPFVADRSEITVDDIRPRSGYTMNVTGPKGLPGISGVLQDENRVPQVIMFANMTNLPSFGSNLMTFRAAALRIDYHVAPYSPLPEKTFTQNNNLGYGVTLLWDKTITKPLGGNLTFSIGSASYMDGVWTVESKETMQRWGFSLTTGDQIWGPSQPQAAFDMYGMSSTVAYGKIYSCGYAGILYSYDIKTGNLLWTYNATGIGYESPYGDYPLSIGAIADGKVYLYSTEHSPTIPLWRGSYLRCVDATNGQELWKLLDFNMGLSLADGYIVTGNKYDNRMYAIGKGPSAVNVEIQSDIIAKGSSVLIKGTVTDQSPGAKDTPAIADQYMQQWMEYLYEQQSIPGNAQGVQVKLSAVDANGAAQDLGTTTSDMSGMFKIVWKPAESGIYTIIATFEGSNSYFPSYAETALGVTNPEATATPAPIKTVNQVSAEAFYAFAALITIVVLVVAVLLYRKK